VNRVALLSTEMKKWVGRSLPPRRETATRTEIRKYAIATNQTLRKFLDGDEAPPLFYFSLFFDYGELGELGPDGIRAHNPILPDLPLKRAMAGGLELEFERPIHPGDRLVGTRTLTDLYEKAGRSGPLIFYDTELRIETEVGELVLVERATRILR